LRLRTFAVATAGRTRFALTGRPCGLLLRLLLRLRLCATRLLFLAATLPAATTTATATVGRRLTLGQLLACGGIRFERLLLHPLLRLALRLRAAVARLLLAPLRLWRLLLAAAFLLLRLPLLALRTIALRRPLVRTLRFPAAALLAGPLLPLLHLLLDIAARLRFLSRAELIEPAIRTALPTLGI
jgi:hypothetical protein